VDFRKHPPHPGVEQQRLVVLDQEMIELQVELGHMNRYSKQIWRDLVDPGHRPPPDAVPLPAS
jgi:hypothetical protein